MAAVPIHEVLSIGARAACDYIDVEVRVIRDLESLLRIYGPTSR
jgi:hypothetical protein